MGALGLGLGCGSAQTSQHLKSTLDASSLPLATHEQHNGKAPSPALGKQLNRDQIVALAVEKSSSLRALAHRARALVYAAKAEGSLPAPEVEGQIWNAPLLRPYALGEADMFMLEFRQRFPAAGAQDARARASSEEARALLAELLGEEQLTAERAANAYADYVHGLQDHALHREHLAQLEQLQQAVQARFTTGGSGLADVARVELEIGIARRAIARTSGEIARSRSLINALLKRPIEAPLGSPEAARAETVRLSLSELYALASSRRGPKVAAALRIRAARARTEAAEAEAKNPEFMLGIGYWQAPQSRPGIGANASMTLPWLWGSERHRVDEAREHEAAETSSQGAESTTAETEVSEAYVRLTSMTDELKVVHEQAIPAAHRAIDAVQAAYTTGHASLLDWVASARAVLDLQMEETALTADLAYSVATLERAVGAPLPRVAVLPESQP